MSIDHDPLTPQNQQGEKVKVPNTLTPYTDEEKKLARDVQASAEARKRRLGHFGVGGLVVALAATGVFIGSKFIGGDKAPSAENPAPTPDTTSSATASPGETEAPAATEVQPLSAEVYTTNEAVVTGFIDRINDWTVASATEEAYNKYVQYNGSQTPDQVAQEVVGSVNDEYMRVLFTDGISDSNTLAAIDRQNLAHERAVMANIQTRANADLLGMSDVPYEATNEIISIDIIPGDNESSFTANVQLMCHDNAVDNSVGEGIMQSCEGNITTMTVTATKDSENNYDITSWEWL